MRASKASVGARACATWLLYDLCADASGASLLAELKLNEPLITHVAVGLTLGDPKLKYASMKLLGKLAPSAASWRTRIVKACMDELSESPAGPGGCPICMQDESDAGCTGVVYLPCFHSFHRGCVLEWLGRGKDECPMCKAAVVKNILQGQNKFTS
jgi:hypothetical protein